jgi:acylphosphatase
MDQSELAALLTQSRKNNSESDITGVLMYADGTFIQVLEGEKKAVEHLFEIIQRDPRHKNVIEIVSGEEEKRTFPDWLMAFLTPESGKMTELAGYINPLNTDLFKDDRDNTILTVLRTFADNNDLTYFG